MITVRLPDGREIQVNTDDPKAASAAAKKYVAASAKPAPEKPKSFGEKVWGTMTDAAADLAETSKPLPQGRNPFKDPVGAAKDIGEQISRSASVPVKAFNLLASPITGVVEAGVVEPYGGAMSTIFKGTDAADWEGDMRTALMAARPGRARAPKPVKVNKLAEPVAAFERANVTPSLAAVQGGGAAKVANAVAENPIAGIRVRKAMRTQVAEAETAAQRVAGKAGTPTTRGAQGEALKEGVKAFNERFSERSSKLYDKAFADIEAGEAQAVATAQQRATRQSAMGGAAPGPAPVIQPNATKAALSEMGGRVNASELSSIITDPRLNKIAKALEEGGADVRFGDLRALRTWVREAKTNDDLRQGIGSAGLQRLEGALTDDILANAERVAGPQAARRLRQTDEFYRLGNERIQGALQNFVGKGSSKPAEATYDLLIRSLSDKGGADIARATALKKSLKADEWGDVAATVIENLGKPTAGSADQGFSVSRFVTNYEGLSPAGRKLLVSDPSLKRELDNLAYVMGRLKTVERGANSSNSGTAVQSAGTIVGLANPATAIPAAKVLGGMALSGEIVTSPGAVRWLARLGQAQAQGPQQVSVVVKQLEKAAQANAALMPLYQESQKLLLVAPRVSEAATAEEEPQPARP